MPISASASSAPVFAPPAADGGADLGEEPRERVRDDESGDERNDVRQRRVTDFGRELHFVLSDPCHPGRPSTVYQPAPSMNWTMPATQTAT